MITCKCWGNSVSSVPPCFYAARILGDTTLQVGCKLVSPEYFDLLGIRVLEGRIFAPDERNPSPL